MKITVSTAATMLILQQLQLTTANDNTSTRHDYMPILKGAKQHAQLAGYIATADSTDPYWSQFNNAISVHNGNLKPFNERPRRMTILSSLRHMLSGVVFVRQLLHFMMVQPNTLMMLVG